MLSDRTGPQIGGFFYVQRQRLSPHLKRGGFKPRIKPLTIPAAMLPYAISFPPIRRGLYRLSGAIALKGV
jgi:hypothetical protein